MSSDETPDKGGSRAKSHRVFYDLPDLTPSQMAIFGQTMNEFQTQFITMLERRRGNGLAFNIDVCDIVAKASAKASRSPAFPTLTTERQYGFLKRCVNRYYIDAWRHETTDKQKIHAGVSLLSESNYPLVQGFYCSSTPSRQMCRDEQCEQILKAFCTLSPADRIVLWLFHVDGLPLNEIAKTLKVTPAAVKKRHVRALNRWRDVWLRQPFNRDAE